MEKEGFKGIDINMGCPVANVAENGKGKWTDLPARHRSGDYSGRESRGTAGQCKNASRIY